GAARLPYAGLLDRVQRLAGGLAERSIAAGGRVAAIVKCRRESVELYWACQWLGATWVPLSHRVSEADIDYCVSDCGAKLVFPVDLDVEPLLGGPHPGALDRDDREASLMLY